MSVGSVANKVISIGKDVAYGMRGDYKGFTKEIGKKILNSNMTDAQLREFSKQSLKKAVENGQGANVKKILDKAEVNMAKKELSSAGKAWGEGIEDKILGRGIAKGNMAFKIGDAIGGGVRDTMRSRKAGHDFKTALNAGFTKAGENGVRQVRMDRVAGAAFGASVVGRVASGGGLYRDRYGRVNAPGVPFI